MDIGTAKITAEEMQGVKHYMLDVVEPIKSIVLVIIKQQLIVF